MCARVATPEPKTQTISSTKESPPVQDEWGIYDPEQAGLEAVFRKLMTVAGDDDEMPKPAASSAPDHR
jgi:hypothetical protein